MRRARPSWGSIARGALTDAEGGDFGSGGSAAERTTIGSKLAIGRGFPFSSTVKSSAVRPVTGRPALSTTTASIRTISVAAGKRGGSWARAAVPSTSAAIAQARAATVAASSGRPVRPWLPPEGIQGTPVRSRARPAAAEAAAPSAEHGTAANRHSGRNDWSRRAARCRTGRRTIQPQWQTRPRKFTTERPRLTREVDGPRPWPGQKSPGRDRSAGAREWPEALAPDLLVSGVVDAWSPLSKEIRERRSRKNRAGRPPGRRRAPARAGDSHLPLRRPGRPARPGGARPEGQDRRRPPGRRGPGLRGRDALRDRVVPARAGAGKGRARTTAGRTVSGDAPASAPEATTPSRANLVVLVFDTSRSRPPRSPARAPSTCSRGSSRPTPGSRSSRSTAACACCRPSRATRRGSPRPWTSRRRATTHGAPAPRRRCSRSDERSRDRRRRRPGRPDRTPRPTPMLAGIGGARGSGYLQRARRPGPARFDSLYGLLALARSLEPVRGRKSIVYFAEAREVPDSVTVAYDTTIGEANRANVTIHTVDTRGLSAQPGRRAKRLRRDDRELLRQGGTRSRRRDRPGS